MTSLMAMLARIQEGALTPVFAVLIDTALKGLVLIAVAAAAAYLLRKKSAAARHAVWTAAVVGHLALPVVTLLVPQWRLPLLPAPAWVDAPPPSSTIRETTVGTARPVSTTQAVSPVQGPAPVEPKAIEAISRWPTASLLGMLWVLGTTVVLLRLAVGTWTVGRLAKHGDRVDDGEWLSLTQRVANRLGITRPLTLLRGDSLAVPVTWGVVYPAVLLPPEANEWPESRRRFVLVHEMAHIKRFDALTQLVAQITLAILWFDPFLWYAAHRMRVEREHACDDYVLRDGTAPSLYAGELLEMVRSIGSPRRETAAPAFAALAMARRSEFEGRMLAILDSRQERKSLGRRSAIIATAALALVLLPLAALRPFEARAAVPIVVQAQMPATVTERATPAAADPGISVTACDSVMRIPVDASNNTRWTHLHVLEDDAKRRTTLEFLSSSPGRCAQAIISGPVTFANDQIATLPPGSHAYFREISRAENRLLRIEPAPGGRLAYSAAVNGAAAPYDEGTRAWIARLLPEALRETAVDAPERVARWVTRGGFERALLEIGRINSQAARRIHYIALIDGNVLSDREVDQLRSETRRKLSGSSSDLKAVMAKLPTPRPAESASARILRQYPSTDDPAMILLALQGAKEMSSDTDRRSLLQTVSERALDRKNATLRQAFFAAAAEMTSDTDLRAVLLGALPSGRSDPEVTIATFRAVGSQMTSDTDKRAVLIAAVEQKPIRDKGTRDAFMVAARTIESSTDFTAVMQAALK